MFIEKLVINPMERNGTLRSVPCTSSRFRPCERRNQDKNSMLLPTVAESSNVFNMLRQKAQGHFPYDTAFVVI